MFLVVVIVVVVNASGRFSSKMYFSGPDEVTRGYDRRLRIMGSMKARPPPPHKSSSRRPIIRIILIVVGSILKISAVVAELRSNYAMSLEEKIWRWIVLLLKEETSHREALFILLEVLEACYDLTLCLPDVLYVDNLAVFSR